MFTDEAGAVVTVRGVAVQVVPVVVFTLVIANDNTSSPRLRPGPLKPGITCPAPARSRKNFNYCVEKPYRGSVQSPGIWPTNDR